MSSNDQQCRASQLARVAKELSELEGERRDRRAVRVRARGLSTLAVLEISWWEGPRAMEDGTTILFGLPGVVVDRVQAADDGVRTVQVVTANPAAAACPVCRVFSTLVR